jgi:hypothetical protein
MKNMFFIRVNKIKVFDNREGFLGVFNRSAEMNIYSYVRAFKSITTAPELEYTTGLALSDLMSLPDEAARKQRLLDAVIAEADRLSQSAYLEINGVKDKQTMLFGDSGLVIYSNTYIPDRVDIQLWVIESDSDIRNFAIEADRVLDSDAFKTLFAAVEATLAITNPVLSGVIAVAGVVVNILRQKLRANKDDLVGYWQASLNRVEHFPHGNRDKQNVYDTTGNILVDYTIFGFENYLSSQGRGIASESATKRNAEGATKTDTEEILPDTDKS